MKFFYLIYLFFYFALTIIKSGWFVAYRILKGSRGNNCGVVNYYTKVTNQWHLVFLFNLISMTPGALSVDLSEDTSIIYVHLLDVDQKDVFFRIVAKVEGLLLKAV